MNLLIISPYHGGSHAAWHRGYAKNSRFETTLLSLPDRFWKWRMHGGAVTLARRFMSQLQAPDALLATDMLDLSTFAALTRARTAQLPFFLYMHENQLTYPLRQDGKPGPMRRQRGERDHHYVFINYASMLTAAAIFFNSQFHLESWFAALPKFLKHFPEYNELGTLAALRRKSYVLPVGIELETLQTGKEDTAAPMSDTRPLILWNQRWEYDKQPARFFEALSQVWAEGFRFRLALCGQVFGKRPSAFDQAVTQFADALVHVGYADPATYYRLLWQADITVSTAVHEFFGISILEAIACRTFPILPQRLSYPELIPTDAHDACLYANKAQLLTKLRWALTHAAERAHIADRLATAAASYDWRRVAPQYDAKIEELTANFHQQRSAST